MQYLKRLTPQVDTKQNSTANTIYVDKDTEAIKVGTGASGNSERTLGDSVVGISLPDGLVTAPSAFFTSDPDTGIYWRQSGEFVFANNGTAYTAFDGNVRLHSASVFSWTSGTGIGTADTSLAREAAGTLAQRNGTNAQLFSVYNTYTSATNHEKFSVDWQTTSNVAWVGTRTAATGTGRVLRLAAQSSNGADSYFAIQLQDTALPFLHVGRTNAAGTFVGATSGNGNYFQFTSGHTATSGSQVSFALLPAYNQAASTAANTDLLINRTETAVGSGAQNFIEAQVGGSAAFRVSAIGAVYSNITSAIPAGGNTAISYRCTSTANFGMFFGSGAPTLTAAKGSIYLRSDGSSTSTRLYVATDSAGAWTAITTAT